MKEGNHVWDRFKDLTWEDMEDWAGSRALSKGKSYRSRVSELAVTPAGGLVAAVRGREEYKTLVGLQEGGLFSKCTCPVLFSCKHAVAVVLEYLDRIKKGDEIPVIESGDTRLRGITGNGSLNPGGDDPSEEETETAGRQGPLPNMTGELQDLKEYLERMTRDKLVELLMEEAGKYPSMREDVLHMKRLSDGDVNTVVEHVRADILRISAEPAWRNHWNDEGHIPDYSRVRNSLESLLRRGQADAVIGLGEELLAAGIQQIEMSHDQGETAGEISSCLEVVFRALSLSSLSPAEQMLWAINAELGNDHDLCYGARDFWDMEKEPHHWSAVADDLRERLNNLTFADKEDGFSHDYARDRLSDWVITALERAGRREEVVPLCEEEAIRTGSYIRLVNILREEGRREEAHQWILKGVRASSGRYPGIAVKLIDALRETREKDDNWPAAAAIRAAEFLRRPSFQAYDKLRQASERAGVWPLVREAILAYLETGESPHSHRTWPLPESEIEIDRSSHQDKPPMADTLIEIAIHEKRPDEIIRWYDSEPKKHGYHARWSEGMEDRIAGGIKSAHPDRALAIWKELAERQIALTKPAAYGVAAWHLKELRGLLISLGRIEEWTQYLKDLRRLNARKSSLLKILARLDGQRVIDGEGN